MSCGLILASQEKTFFFAESALAADLAQTLYVIHPSEWSKKYYGQSKYDNRFVDLVFDWKLARRVERSDVLLSSELIDEVIRLDRRVREWPRSEATNYINNFCLFFNNVIARNDILFCLAEFTWAHEHAAYFLCASNNINVAYLDEVKVPEKRLALFDRTKTRLLDLGKDSSCTDEKVPKVYGQHYLKSLARTRCLSTVGRTLVRHLKLNSWEGGDPTVRPMTSLFAMYVGGLLTRKVLVLLRVLIRIPDKPLVYFLLHRKPDSAIDVQKAEFQDQIKLVKRLVQANTKLDFLVRFHPHETSFIALIRLILLYLTQSRVHIDVTPTSIHQKPNIDKVISVAGTGSLESYQFERVGLVFASTYYSKVFDCEIGADFDLDALNKKPKEINTLLEQWNRLAKARSEPGLILGNFDRESREFRSSVDSAARLIRRWVLDV